MIKLLVFPLLITGLAIDWITASRLENLKGIIAASNEKYARELYRDNPLSILFFRRSTRVMTLLFVAPPEDLKELINPFRKAEAISILCFGLAVASAVLN